MSRVEGGAFRFFDTVEVRSSSLLVPTISFNHLQIFRSLPTAPPRSNKALNGCSHYNQHFISAQAH